MGQPRRKSIRLPARLYAQPGRAFLTTICCHDHQRVFSDLAFGRSCIDLLSLLRDQTGNRVFAYCLMPDHVHLLVGIEGLDLLAFIQRWKSLSYKSWRQRGRAGSFWQRSFHDTAVRSGEALRARARYVVANPVRAGLVDRVDEYPLAGSMEWEL